MQKTFFIADTHFGHKAIIDYENRPFSSVEEMDEVLISNWNSVVGKDDRVFMLGDFSFYGKRDAIMLILRRLNGRKSLVVGNHDTSHSAAWWRSVGFDEAYKYPIILDGFLILSHEPMYINTNMPYANIFGHVHGRPEYRDLSPQTFCVSVERIGYRPLELDEVKRRIREAMK